MTEQHRCPECGSLMFAVAVRHNGQAETVWKCSRRHGSPLRTYRQPKGASTEAGVPMPTLADKKTK